MFLRIAQLSEGEEVVEAANIRAYNLNLQQSKHLIKQLKIIIKFMKLYVMFDLGDLREGIYYEDSYLKLVEEILTFNNIKLLGLELI